MRQRAKFLRAFSLVFMAAGFFLSSGLTSNALADSVVNTAPSKSNLSQVSKPVKASKRRSVRSSSHKKLKHALHRSVKSSLRRLPAPKYSRSTSRRSRGLHPRLTRLLALVRRHYGRSLIISSGCRSHRHNRLVGGARRSMHLRCMAADFKVAGVSKASLRRYVSNLPGRGGVGTYCGRSIVHLDVGPRRSWYHGCRKRRKRRS